LMYLSIYQLDTKGSFPILENCLLQPIEKQSVSSNNGKVFPATVEIRAAVNTPAKQTFNLRVISRAFTVISRS
jgi:hypothetical protein